MHLQSFALAPRPGSHEWGQALAFALPPAAGIYAVLHWIVDQPGLGLIAAPIVFLGVFLSALLLIRPQIGAIELDAHHLRLVSGSLDVRIPLDVLNLDLIASGTPPIDGPTISLVTDSSRTLTIYLLTGGSVAVSPLDPAAFLANVPTHTPATTASR